MKSIVRLKDLGSFNTGLTYSLDNLCNEDEGILVLRSSNIQDEKLVLDDNVYVNTSVTPAMKVRVGDILICSRNGSARLVGKTAVIDRDINATWGAFMMLFRTKHNYRYLYYLLNASISKNKAMFSTSTINQLTNSMLGNIYVDFYSNPQMQDKIAKYLDVQTNTIDKRIFVLSKKQDAYTRLKTRIINHAVTRGLDENVELKDSGIERLGKIPAHWDAGRLKSVSEEIEAGKRPTNDNEEVLSIGGEHIQKGKFFLEHPKYVSKQTYKSSKGKISLGDTLIVKDGATIGKSMYVEELPQSLMLLNEHVYRLKFGKYYYYWVTSDFSQYWFRSRNMSSAQESITLDTIKSLPVFIPPLSEQQAIANYLDEKCAKIDAAVANIEKQIDAMKRLKKALINEVVTGKREI